MAMNPEPESLLAEGPVRDFSFVGLFNGAPGLQDRHQVTAMRQCASDLFAPGPIRTSRPGRASRRR
jgi:hypothetical protein